MRLFELDDRTMAMSTAATLVASMAAALLGYVGIGFALFVAAATPLPSRTGAALLRWIAKRRVRPSFRSLADGENRLVVPGTRSEPAEQNLGARGMRVCPLRSQFTAARTFPQSDRTSCRPFRGDAQRALSQCLT
jgi:hypothetical protein